MKNLGNVYFVLCGKFVKIGFALDVGKRLAELQTGNPQPLAMIAVIPNCAPSVERMYHQAFAEARVRGEWFHSKALRRIVVQIQCGAAPRTLAAIEHYVDLKGLRGPIVQPGVNKACTEVRVAMVNGTNWAVEREVWKARGPEYAAAVAIIERRLTKRRRLKYGAPVAN
jgi:hypothetical protein